MGKQKMKMGYKENQVFKSYGHKCQMAKQLDYVYHLEPDNDFEGKIKRFLYRNVTIGQTHPKTKKYMKSQFIVGEGMKKHLESPTIIHPFSSFRLWWDFIMIFFVMLILIIQPLQAACYLFENLDLDHVDYVYYIATGVVFTLNIIIEFRSGYWDNTHQVVVLRKKDIAVHYLVTFFLVDVCIVIPVIPSWDKMKGGHSLLIGILLLKISSIVRGFKMMQDIVMFMEMANMSYSLRRIAELIIFCMLYVHWQSCYNVFLVNLTNAEYAKRISARDWLGDSGENSISTLNLWANLFFVCTRVFAQAGVNTVNVIQKFYVLEVSSWFVARGVLIFIITSMMLAFKSKRMSISKNNEMFWHLEVYMRSKGMPDYLRNRLLVFYEFRYQKSFFRESEIMNTVTGQLKQEMIMHNCRKLLENVSFFKKMPLNFLARIITRMVEEVYLTNDVILKADSIPTCMYFISSGTVAVYTATGEEITHLLEGDHFGEIGLVIPGMKRIATVVAAEICELFRLDRDDFKMAVSPFPDLLTQMESIANKRLEKTRIIEEREYQMEITNSF